MKGKMKRRVRGKSQKESRSLGGPWGKCTTFVVGRLKDILGDECLICITCICLHKCKCLPNSENNM